MPEQVTAAPVADWVDPREMLADPYPTFARLRAESPVAWVPALHHYLVTTFDEARTIELDQERFTSEMGQSPMPRTMRRPTMLNFDDPAHAAQRQPINSGLRPKAMKEHWRPLFVANTLRCLDRLAQAGPGSADLNADFAAPLSTMNLSDLVGLRGADADDVRRWSLALIGGLGNVHNDPVIWSRVDQARDEMLQLIRDLIPYYRANPDLSLTSALANAGLADELIAGNVMLAISGGMNEPQHAITSMVWALSEHPDQRAEVIADGDLWPAVFDETLRWISPIGYIPREVTQDTVLGGVEVSKGAAIAVMASSANRDETHFERADQFDIHRPKVPTYTFGTGAHQCAGMWAARWSIGNVAVPMLFERFEGIRTADDRPSKWWGFFFRGLTEHAVTWTTDRGLAAQHA